MSRIEPNILLAASTGVAMLLLIMTASLFGEPGNALKYVISAVICAGLFITLNGRMARLMNRPEPQPMIRAGSPSMTIWAALFPIALITAAGVPVVLPGHDYGLMIVITAIWFGVTADSAVRAARA